MANTIINILKFKSKKDYLKMTKIAVDNYKDINMTELRPNDFEILFYTYQNGVPKIMQALSKKAPDIKFIYAFASQNIIGDTLGIGVGYNGNIHMANLEKFTQIEQDNFAYLVHGFTYNKLMYNNANGALLLKYKFENFLDKNNKKNFRQAQPSDIKPLEYYAAWCDTLDYLFMIDKF